LLQQFGEKLAGEVAVGVERDDALGVAPLRERTDGAMASARYSE
jgi:hypothetical protein